MNGVRNALPLRRLKPRTKERQNKMMKFRQNKYAALLAAVGMVCACPAVNPNRIKPLADSYVEVFRSPDPKTVYCYTPGIARLDTGRLVATCDFGGRDLPKGMWGGRVAVSDDRGRTWRQTGRFPMCHARPFTAGGRLYILGHRGNLGVCVSTDKGETWSEVGWLTKGAELASVRLQRLVRKGERLSRDGADGALSRRTEVRLGRESPGTRPHAGQGDGRPHAAGKLDICGVVPL